MKEPRWADTVDLLELVDVEQDRVQGKWEKKEGGLFSNKQFGARIELPYQPPAEYQLTVVARPLDPPNGLVLGQVVNGKRFLVLTNYQAGEPAVGALENIDGKNFLDNPTQYRASLLRQDVPSTIVCQVRTNSVSVTCDGRKVIDWKGKPEQLSLSDYWKTPNDNALFVGAYDCRYQIERITLTPIRGEGSKRRREEE